MSNPLSRSLASLARWWKGKRALSIHDDRGWVNCDPGGSSRSLRSPSPRELLAELKNTAWACASINSAACASYSPQLYVATYVGQPSPRCRTRALAPKAQDSLRRSPSLPARIAKAARIEEVLEHPLLALLDQVNPEHNGRDLLELTTLYQETLGSAYWLLRQGPLGIPKEIWILPSQYVTPIRGQGTAAVEGYEYRTGAAAQRFAAEEIVHFRYPDPRDPYGPGLPPLRACWESVSLTSSYTAFKQAMWDNAGLPSAVLSPPAYLGEEERDRLEKQWRQKFRHGGAGQVLIADNDVKLNILSHSLGDLAALAEYGKTKEDIANAFHVPLSYLVSETNLANLQAAERQHLALAVRPRLQRRDQKLNERLLPLYDPSGRLFVASPDPTPHDARLALDQQASDLRWGVRSINEIRQDRGLDPVPWGDKR